jgi:hypothetical protein
MLCTGVVCVLCAVQSDVVVWQHVVCRYGVCVLCAVCCAE